MPHANLQSHFARQSSWDPQLLSLPRATAVITKLREIGEKNGSVPLPALAELVAANYRHLQTLVSHRELVQVHPRSSLVTLDSALSVVPQFLPRILGWSSVSDLGKEMGVHRNTVATIVALHGKPEMLRLCRDNCLYISPEGEALVRGRKQAHEQIAHLETLSDFAKGLNIPLNRLTAFFSKRASKFPVDIHGRARITEEQKKLYLDSIAVRQQRLNRADAVIEGSVFRSCLRVAADQAALFTRPGSDAHRALAAQIEHSVRHFAEMSGTVRKTKLGVCIPTETANRIMSSINLTAAARVLGLPKQTISAWRKKYGEMKPPITAATRRRGISLSGLVEVAYKRFLEDPNLSSLSNVPTIISSLMANQLANKLGTQFSKVVELLPITAEDRQRLEQRVGSLPRETHKTITSLLRREPGQRTTVVVTKEMLQTMCSNAEHLGLSALEFLEVALSPRIAAKCLPDYRPVRVSAERYRSLLGLALVNPSEFNLSAIVSADAVSQILVRWCDAQKVHISTAMAILDLPQDDRRSIREERGELSGLSVKKAMALVRLSGDVARKVYPHIFINGPRYEEPADRASNRALWGKRMLEAPVSSTVEELNALLALPNNKGKELVTLCLSPRLISTLVTNVAQSRNVKPHDAYLFTRETLLPHSVWPPSFGEFLRVIEQEASAHRFSLVVGKFLLDLSDPQRKVYAYGTSRAIPREGDIFTHPNMHDYGIVQRIFQDEGGTKALVDLVLEDRSLIFRV